MSTALHTSSDSFGIPGSTLKLLAMFSMLIDHIGYILLWPLANAGVIPVTVYSISRSFGRLAFPIFCFLLIQGFCNTRSPRRYLCSLLIFAGISEIPFDLAFHRTWFYPLGQNVYFTLAIGLALLICTDAIANKITSAFLRNILTACAVLTACAAGCFLRCDYGAFGVLAIFVMYLLRLKKLPCFFWGCTVLTLHNPSELFAYFALIPIRRYNGERGLQFKYLFYFFYPVHLLLLTFLAWVLRM